VCPSSLREVIVWKALLQVSTVERGDLLRYGLARFVSALILAAVGTARLSRLCDGSSPSHPVVSRELPHSFFVNLRAQSDGPGPFNRVDDIVERDLFGRTGKGLSTACTSLGFNKPTANQIWNDFLKKLFRHSVLFGKLGY